MYGLLSCFAAASIAQVAQLSPPESTQPALAASPASPGPTASTQLRDSFYLSHLFGFRFTSPQGYVITPSETQPSQKPTPPLQVLEIWQQADFLNRASLPEAPPIISITVYNNPKRLPLTHWKGELSRQDDRPITVAGRKGITYSSTGLYESDNILIDSPDRRFVFRLAVGYMDSKAAIRKVFQEFVTSFTFDVTPDPKAASKWRINYSRLQNLLAAKNWSGADLETRAILQRLAGPRGDLLFNSKAVLARMPLQDLQTLDNLWSKASNGRFGFTAQQRIWQQATNRGSGAKARVEQFAQVIEWRRTQPSGQPRPDRLGLGKTPWRLDTELNYTTTAPVGHLPWVGISSSRLADMVNEASLGCGSCTVDAMYLAGDRYYDYLPAFFARFKPTTK